MNIREQVCILAEILRKTDPPGKLYKSSTKNKSFFNKDKFFVVQKGVKTSIVQYFYWIPKNNHETVINKRFLRQELFVLEIHNLFELFFFSIILIFYIKYFRSKKTFNRKTSFYQAIR